MSEVLVASLNEDGARVAPLVEGLRAAGLSVWWVGDFAGGEHRHMIASELETARCVVVVWTTASVGPAGALVQDVADQAQERGILLPVLLDRVTQPLGFRQIQSLDLVRWNGKPRHQRFKKLVAAARGIVAENQKAQARTKHKFLQWLAGTLSLATLLAALLSLLGFFSNAHELLVPICQVAGIRTVCARWGLGGVPTPAEEEAWAARKPGDCSALQAHLARFPDGGYVDEAERKLLAPETEVMERWQAEEHSLPLTVRAAYEPLPSEAEARADALARAGADAEMVCAGYKAGPYRLRTATAKLVDWRCSASRGGFLCGFDGQAICQVDARTREQREICR